MPAAIHSFIIEQGQDWERYVLWKDSAGSGKDLAGLTAVMVIRYFQGDLTTEIETVTVATSTPGSYNLKLTLTDVQTAALDFLGGWYTLNVIMGDTLEHRVLEGNIYLSKEVTQA